MKKFILLIALASFFVAPAFMPGEQEQNDGKAIQSSGLTAEARTAILTLGDDLAKLNESRETLIKAVSELEGLYLRLSQKVQEVSRIALAGEKSRGRELKELFLAINSLQKMEVQFNGQFLKLSNAISQENRQGEMYSNIMKTNHNTARNAITNNR